MNINLKRYSDATSFNGFIKQCQKYSKIKFCRQFLISLEIKFRSWLICGFCYIKNNNVKGGRTWNDNYHLMSKLCRYETWDDVKINWWDKIRFRIITGCKFE